MDILLQRMARLAGSATSAKSKRAGYEPLKPEEKVCQVCGAQWPGGPTWVFCVGTAPDGNTYLHTYCSPEHAIEGGDWIR